MKVLEITVSAGRTFNDPYEQFANYRPSVTLRATLDDSDNPTEVAEKLQRKAEQLVEDCKKKILARAAKIDSMQLEIFEKENEIRGLKSGCDIPF